MPYMLFKQKKQKCKRFYGLQETQFRNLFDKAARKSGITGENLLILLETRLDNVVFRLGFASSRKEARQLVNHGHFQVNGKRVNIPSYLIKEGDVISVAEKSKSLPKIKAVLENTDGKVIPKWLELDRENASGKVVTLAQRDDIDLDIQETLIVELYSK